MYHVARITIGVARYRKSREENAWKIQVRLASSFFAFIVLIFNCTFTHLSNNVVHWSSFRSTILRPCDEHAIERLLENQLVHST